MKKNLHGGARNQFCEFGWNPTRVTGILLLVLLSSAPSHAQPLTNVRGETVLL